MNILGVDVGNHTVKLDTGVTFNSTVKAGHINMNKDDIKISYNGREYTIGSMDGNRSIGDNKYNKLNFKLLLLTAIAKGCNANKKTIISNIVMGVPISLFNNKEVVKDIEKTVKGFKGEEITVNGVSKVITVNDARVFCESAVVFNDRVKNAGKKVLIVDIGGSTVDVSVWDNFRLNTYKSYKTGTLSLCESISGLISSKEKVLFKAENIPDVIDKRTIAIHQSLVDVSYISDEIQGYIDSLSSKIYQSFAPEEMDEILFVGGGSSLLCNYISEEFTTAIISKDAQLLNAKTYKTIGASIWQ